MTITVAAVNDPPSLSSPAQTLLPGDPLAPLSARDPTATLSPLASWVERLPSGVTMATDGTFSGTVRSPGVTVARIRACDPAGACADSELRIEVRGGPVPAGVLPHTGAPAGRLAAVGAGLLLAGLLLGFILRPARLPRRGPGAG